MTQTSTIAAVFGETAAGHLAGKVEDLSWLAAPHGGGFRIMSGWRLRKPMPDWTLADFSGASAIVPDLAAFRAYVEDVAEHRRQISMLGRRPGIAGISTPWGRSDSAEIYGEGVVFHTTPSHGGIKLDRARNAAMPAALRIAGGWYEEDSEWARVAAAFPDLFTDYERRHADDTLRNWYPDCWEAVHGRKLAPGESRTKDQLRFLADHASDWIVVSARTSAAHPGMVDCVAARGGDYATPERRRYRVPAGEYDHRPFGFVIDERRHQRFDDEAAAN